MADKTLHGSLKVPGDKSISHRALMFSALVKGEVKINGLSPAEDCNSTAKCLRELGLEINTLENGQVHVKSPGIANLKAPRAVLDAGNSGTTMRIMSGLVAGCAFASTFDGDHSLRKRPMSRVLNQLEKMGARVVYEGSNGRKNGYAPFTIEGTELHGHDFELQIASAQVQTALMLAGLQADGKTTIKLETTVRDHTARMFKFMGVPFQDDGKGTLSVEKLNADIPGCELHVPSDISSAAFFMVAASCLKGSDVLLLNCGMNPGRRLIVDVLLRMGADLTLENERELAGEPVADIRVKGSGRLKGITISGEEVAAGIDELPILALAGALCEGTFKVEGAEELRHKESDRLSLICNNLSAIGAVVREKPDGFELDGQRSLQGGAKWKTHEDHRLAMMGFIAQLLCQVPNDLEETESVKISYPTFKQDLDSLIR